MIDPRPELAYDSADWKKLLEIAETVNGKLAGTLHGFRCCGLRLHRGGKGYVLRPDFDPNSSMWTSQAEYESDRDKWLLPYREKLIELLRKLSDMYE
ncbi:MAG: hypothetical protein ACYC0N_00725 [Carboxydocellales bacterium]